VPSAEKRTPPIGRGTPGDTVNARVTWKCVASCRVSAAAARTTSQSTFGDIPSLQIRLALLMARNTRPSAMAAVVVHATRLGVGRSR